MRTTLIAAAVIAASAVGYYTYTQSTSGIAMPELALVPADTAILSVQVKPIDLPSYLASAGFMTPEMVATSKADLEALLEADAEPGSGLLFGINLYAQFLDALAQPADFTKLTGISEQAQSLFYMVGAAPVIRVKIADQAAFEAMFARAEASTGYQGTSETVAGHSVTRYPVYADDFDDTRVDLLVAVRDGWATLTIDTASLSAQTLAVRLALEAPTESVASTGYLTEVMKRYQLRADGLGYIRTDIIANALVKPDSNQLGLDIRALSSGESDQDLAAWQTAECQVDVGAIAKLWPGIFFDATFDQSQAGSTTVESVMLIPTHDADTLTRLQDLRGFIPDAIEGNLANAMFYAGLGTDVGRLAPNLSQLWVAATNASYTCAPLQEWQAAMKANNPMGGLAVTQMLSGLTGFAVRADDFDLSMFGMPSADGSEPGKMNMVISLSADDIETLFGTIQSFDPNLAALSLPAVGESIEFPAEDMGLPVSGFMHRGVNTLAIGISEDSNALAHKVAGQASTKNGILSVGFNYGKLFGLLGPMMEMEGEPMTPEIEAMINSKMQLEFSMDVNQHGLVIDYAMTVAKP